MRSYAHPLLFLALFLPGLSVLADGPADNIAEQVRQVPKPGIEVPEADRKELDDGLAALKAQLEQIDKRAAGKDALCREHAPDVRVYEKAVRDALTYNEIFVKEEIARAKEILRLGRERADDLLNGRASWMQKKGPVAFGYVSKIDGSVQPYGLVVPASYSPAGDKKFRLDLWFHGRGENLSELNFVDERGRRIGEFSPADTIVLHPYGRFCNANKLAGEVDAFEAIDSVRKRFRIDEDRISAGFSMGGARHGTSPCIMPTIGLPPTQGPDFQRRILERVSALGVAFTMVREEALAMYDCNEYAANLLQCPTVAYSGEIDNQKQAADVMAEALKAEGVELMHVIGPKTPHRYHPDAKREVEAKLDSLAVVGRERYPRSIALVTYTLKYNHMDEL